jgi:hypothetical protein
MGVPITPTVTQSILTAQDDKLYAFTKETNPGGKESHCKRNEKTGGKSTRVKVAK